MHWRKYFILRALLIFITSIFVVPDFKFYLVSIVPFVFDELLLMGLFRGKAKEAVISFLPPYSPSSTYFTSIILTSLSMKSEPELNKKMKMIKMKIKKIPPLYSWDSFMLLIFSRYFRWTFLLFSSAFTLHPPTKLFQSNAIHVHPLISILT